ncbi:tyrosine-type recombinase/integrase [Streptomyces sp. NPDC005318]|uniref:tyrosine-type recombinase/integrase n=1 Tax=Streptomyces sp. NPDC005318 TaxID=3157031 RepID=UPI0033BA8035
MRRPLALALRSEFDSKWTWSSQTWSIVLARGLRQGQARGLRWADVHTGSGALCVRKNRLRPKYLHGCSGDCGTKPDYRKKRVRKNEDTATTKSRAGRRVIGVPDALVRPLELHRREQERERAIAGKGGRESGVVFTSPVGEPLVPSTDHDAWKRLLADAKARDGHLHDAGRTAATALLIVGIPERVVMQIMGWSSTVMVARYQHVTGGVLAGVAQRVGGLVRDVAEDPGEDGPEGSEES